MVRSPSGVTRMSEREVPAIPAGFLTGALSKATLSRLDVVGEDPAKFVVGDLADEADLPPNEATPTAVLAAEPPEISSAGPHAGIECRHAGIIDQTHAALRATMPGEIGIVAAADDVDNGVTYGDDIGEVADMARCISSKRTGRFGA